MDLTPAQLGASVVERCRALGFADAGIAPALPIDADHAEAYRRWVAAGKHGEMHYLAANLETRLDPRRLMPGSKSVIMVADQYHARDHTGKDGSLRPSGPSNPPTHGAIARYARGDDYHDAMKSRLHALCDALRTEHPRHEFRAFVDTAPVHERDHAVRAGLGWIGKNTLLIHPRRGSWMFLGGVLTTLELHSPPTQRRHEDHCGTCTRCIDACPTGAITPYSVDATRCVSYLTIEHRSDLPPEHAERFGGWLYGCDVCQEVCPHNSPRHPGVDVGEVNPAYTARRASFDVLEVLGWTEEDRRRALQGSAMKRAKLGMWQRNARALLGSSSPPGADG